MRHASENIDRQRPSRLQQEVAERILRLLHDGKLAPGTRLNENSLARHLNVSRTPVRGALAHLADQGLVAQGANRGVELLPRPLPMPDPERPDAEDELFVRIARARQAGEFADAFSETQMMRRFGLSRAAVQQALGRLADLELVARKLGHGWRFLPTIQDAETRAESYRFRLLLEPAALLEAGFRLDPAWIETMRARHEAALAQAWRETSSVAFFEMNAAFHEGLAEASGNRFVHSAIRRQNQMRRFANYDWKHGCERVAVSCRDHLEILDRLARGERDVAAALMRRHLETTSLLRRPSPGSD